MSWLRIDDHFPDHPKVVAAGPLAAWLHVCGMAYAARYLTDGFIPAGQLRRLADVEEPDALAEKLIEVGLWHRADGGYDIHDYLKYNPSAAETRQRQAEISAKRAEAGRRGGLARAERLANVANEEANCQSFATNSFKQNASPVPVPVPVPHTRTQIDPRKEDRSLVEGGLEETDERTNDPPSSPLDVLEVWQRQEVEEVMQVLCQGKPPDQTRLKAATRIYLKAMDKFEGCDPVAIAYDYAVWQQGEIEAKRAGKKSARVQSNRIQGWANQIAQKGTWPKFQRQHATEAESDPDAGFFQPSEEDLARVLLLKGGKESLERPKWTA